MMKRIEYICKQRIVQKTTTHKLFNGAIIVLNFLLLDCTQVVSINNKQTITIY